MLGKRVDFVVVFDDHDGRQATLEADVRARKLRWVSVGRSIRDFERVANVDATAINDTGVDAEVCVPERLR